MAAESPLDEFQRYMYGIVYPTQKDVVIQAAERNRAPHDVIQRLETLRHRVAGPHEVLYALRRDPRQGRDPN